MTFTLSTRDFYAVYGKKGDNILEEGKLLGLSQSFLDNLYDMHERMNCILRPSQEYVCNGIPFTFEISALAGMELGMARLAGQRFTYSYRGS